jgi:hypothetical protein
MGNFVVAGVVFFILTAIVTERGAAAASAVVTATRVFYSYSINVRKSKQNKTHRCHSCHRLSFRPRHQGCRCQSHRIDLLRPNQSPCCQRIHHYRLQYIYSCWLSPSAVLHGFFRHRTTARQVREIDCELLNQELKFGPKYLRIYCRGTYH